MYVFSIRLEPNLIQFSWLRFMQVFVFNLFDQFELFWFTVGQVTFFFFEKKVHISIGFWTPNIFPCYEIEKSYYWY